MSKQSDIVKVSQDAGTTGFVNTTGDTMTGDLTLGAGRTHFGKDGANFHWFAADDIAAEPERLAYGFGSDGSSVTDHAFMVGGSNAMIINGSKNVGINKSDPSARLHVLVDGNQDDNNGVIQAETTGTGGTSFIARSQYGTTQFFNWFTYGTRIGSRSVSNGGEGHLHFTTGNDTVHAVLNSSGQFKVGTLGVGGTGDAAVTMFGSNSGDIVQFHQNRNGSTPYWYFNTGGGYGVYSDKRLKENITELPQDAAVDLIRNIKPVEFTWKAEFGKPDYPVTGFLAQDVLSNATTVGQKNILTNWETYDEADPDCPHMGLSDHRMLPSMVGTIQYLLTKIEALEARVAELEAV